MPRTFTNIHDADWREGANARGETWRFLDLGGEHLGVRIEDLPPGGTSSVHHFHSLEEEHVIVLEGAGTLFLGAEVHPIERGDHICFPAGKEEAHHIENTSAAPLKFLVFGERREGDVVVYPDHGAMIVKALGWRRIKYSAG